MVLGGARLVRLVLIFGTSMGPWIHGSMEPWIHGSMDSWIHGSMGPIGLGTFFWVYLLPLVVIGFAMVRPALE